MNEKPITLFELQSRIEFLKIQLKELEDMLFEATLQFNQKK